MRLSAPESHPPGAASGDGLHTDPPRDAEGPACRTAEFPARVQTGG